MNAIRRLLTLVLMFVITASVVPTNAHAQASCDNGIIVDETNSLNVQQVCEAMKPLALKGVKVGLFLSDERYSSEDEWYARIDAVQIASQARFPQTIDNVEQMELHQSGYFLSVGIVDGEMTVTLDVGGTLGSATPIHLADETVKQLVLDGVASNEATESIVIALAEAYRVAYPNANQQFAMPTSQPTATPRPPVDMKPVRNFFAGFAVLAILVGLGWLFLRFGVPVIAELNYLKVLTDRTGEIVRQANLVLAGDEPEGTLLYSRMKANGLQEYSDIETAAVEAIRRTMRKIELVMGNRKMLLDNEKEGVRTLSYREKVEQWEVIYLKLIGTSKNVLEMTEAEIAELLDPMMGFTQAEADTDPDVRDLQAQSRLLEGKPLTVTLRYTKADDIGPEAGILTDIKTLKAQLAELRDAKIEDRPAVNLFKRARK